MELAPDDKSRVPTCEPLDLRDCLKVDDLRPAAFKAAITAWWVPVPDLRRSVGERWVR